MRIFKENKYKTAFHTWYHHLESQVMLFGLLNVLASLEPYINKIIIEKQDYFIIVYLADILIYTNKADYVDAVWYIFD